MANTETMQDLRTMSAEQLQEMLLKLRQEEMNLRFQQATGQMETPNRKREVRKVIARLKLAQSELKKK